jgi:hypothetical protein
MLQDELEIQQEWEQLTNYLKAVTGKKVDLNGVLFLIGVQELGKGVRNFSKEEKQDLMHIAVCKILSYSGFYELEGIDSDGWPHWKPSSKLPFLNLKNQEKMLQIHAIEYFKREIFVQ